MTVFVNGDLYGPSPNIFRPPPEIAAYDRRVSGHWPSTVTCADVNSADPCNVVGSPAVVPGETAVVLYVGWAHASGAPDYEPNGTYVFRFTIHGTVGGTPVDLTADSPKIKMTD